MINVSKEEKRSKASPKNFNAEPLKKECFSTIVDESCVPDIISHNTLLEIDKKEKRILKWDNFYTKKNPWNYVDGYRDRMRIEIIMDYIKWSNSKNVLDIGCGEGSLTLAASEFVQQISAFDLSKNAIEYAKNDRSRGNIDYFQKDATDFVHSDKDYDLILCTEILYYLDNEERITLIQEIRKSLSSNGYFLLSSRVDGRDYKDLDLDRHMELLSKEFRIISVITVWTTKWSHKQIRRICKYLHLNHSYKAFVRSVNPQDAFMCLFICIPL